MALSKLPYKGTRDFFPAQMRVRNYIFSKMSEVSERFAYEPYDGPILEETDLYRAKSGEELINEQIYSFKDRGDREVTIRPEMTPTVARMAAQVHREVPKPIRWYAIPNLMRYEKMQRGRLREFWQYNADIFGAPEGLGEIEILELAVAIMKSFGATHEHFEILINDRRFVDNIFTDVLKCDPEQKKKLYKLVDRSAKISEEKLLADTKEILNNEQKEKTFLQYLKTKSFKEVKSLINGESTLVTFLEKIDLAGLSKYIKFDPTIVRGLDYYTGVVFEIFDKHPENRRAIAGGGAYANLLQIFNEPALAGIGFGMGEVTLTDFLTTHKLLPDFSRASTDVLMAYMIPLAEVATLKLAEQMRSRGISVEVMLGETKPKKAFTQTEKKNYKFVTFIGEGELEKNEVQIKNLETKEQVNVSLQYPEKIFGIFKGN